MFFSFPTARLKEAQGWSCLEACLKKKEKKSRLVIWAGKVTGSEYATTTTKNKTEKQSLEKASA